MLPGIHAGFSDILVLLQILGPVKQLTALVLAVGHDVVSPEPDKAAPARFGRVPHIGIALK